MMNDNVIEYYKTWNREAIKADLDTKRHNFSVLCANLTGDFNKSGVIRSCNAFLGSKIYLYGRKRYDKRGAVGTNHYEHLKHVSVAEGLDSLPKDMIWLGIDNLPGAEPIEIFEWPRDRHVLMCFGEESVGLPQEVLDRCEKLLFIKQYGSVRSLNVASAASIAMYDYVRKLHI